MRKLTDLEVVSHSMVVVALAAAGLYLTAPFVIPLVLAMFLAVMVAPVQIFLESKRVPRLVAVSACLVLVLVGLGLVGLMCGQAVSSVADQSDTYARKLSETWSSITQFSKDNLGVDPNRMLSSDGGGSSQMVSRLSAWAGTVNDYLTGALFTFLYLAFFLAARDHVADKARRFVVDIAGDEEKGTEIVGAVDRQIRDYLWLKLLISVPTGLVFGLVAWAFGVDFPLAWGLVAFTFNFVPSIGPIVATLPPVVIAFIQLDPGLAAAASLALATVQTVSGNVIEPLVLEDRMDMSFVTVLLSIFVWGLIWRIPGLVLGVPLTACIIIVLKRSGRYASLGRLLGA